MPSARAPSMSSSYESPTITVSSGDASSCSSATRKIDGSGLILPCAFDPTFDEETGVVTIVATTGVVYKNAETDATLSTGAQAALDPGETLGVYAVPSSASYYFSDSDADDWSFTRPE